MAPAPVKSPFHAGRTPVPVVLLSIALAASVRADLIAPEADTYIDGSAQTTNFGSSIQLRTKNDAGNFKRKSYIRFNLAALGFDHVTQLQDAALNLEFFDTAAGTGGHSINWEFEVFGLDDGDPDESWLEGGINWQGAPAHSGGNGFLANAASLGTFSFTAVWYFGWWALNQASTSASSRMDTFSFTGRTASVNFSGTTGSEVRDFVAASTSNDLVTFLVRRNTQNASNTYVHAMASREHTSIDPPELVLNQIPEPSSLVLLAGALTWLAFFHTRRRSGTVVFHDR